MISPPFPCHTVASLRTVGMTSRTPLLKKDGNSIKSTIQTDPCDSKGHTHTHLHVHHMVSPVPSGHRTLQKRWTYVHPPGLNLAFHLLTPHQDDVPGSLAHKTSNSWHLKDSRDLVDANTVGSRTSRGQITLQPILVRWRHRGGAAENKDTSVA